jgi:hypothetical protein
MAVAFSIGFMRASVQDRLIMPTDQHGQTHLGTIGLFDDDDEHVASVKRSEHHERERLESAARRLDRRSDRQNRKDVKAA